MSDFCFEDDACQASPTIGDGATEVERVWSIVKDGSKEAIRIEPFLYLVRVRRILKKLYKFSYPMAKVWQSAPGAIDVMGSYIVLADSCSLVEGSNIITSPRSLPVRGQPCGPSMPR